MKRDHLRMQIVPRHFDSIVCLKLTRLKLTKCTSWFYPGSVAPMYNNFTVGMVLKESYIHESFDIPKLFIHTQESRALTSFSKDNYFSLNNYTVMSDCLNKYNGIMMQNC